MMDETLFSQLAEGLQEAAAHARGEVELPADRIHFAGEPDPREIRARLNMTQEQFADALGISVKTLQNWEQGRRDPSGPAMRLLRIADRHPEMLLEAVAAP